MAWMIPRLLKNLIEGPATRRYPVEKRTPFDGSRGALEHRADRCDLCGDCVRLCPAEAIREEGEGESARLAYNPFRCIYCRVCAEGCQHGALVALPAYEPPAAAVAEKRWR